MAEFDTQDARDPAKPSSSSSSPQTKTVGRSRTWRCSPAVEAYYDALVRRLQAIGDGLVGNGPRTIGVTSAEPGEGVTTVTVNLTLAAKKLAPDPILLVDANVARPTVTRIFRARGRMGLENILAGEASVFDCIADSPVEQVSFMPPGNLLSAKRPAYDVASIEETLDNIKHVFPLIIIDLPPVGDLTNCLALAGSLDGVVMVVEANRVNVDVAQRAKHQLQQSGANLLGVVLNKQRS
ncbi:MAG: CpsD/CapB family tyrosine-protein kinase [Planctomycetota bacterium]|nr:CpsD/CapB family tyrosine-protein kinase [Planctomycetota bacterium]